MSTNSVEVKVEARVRIEELRKMEDALQREIVQMRTLGAEAEKVAEAERKLLAVRGQLAAEPRGGKIQASFGEAASSIPGVRGIMAALNGSAMAVAAGLGAVGAAAGVAVSSIKEFAGAETAVAKLDAALGNSGLLNGKYRVELQQFAGEMQQRTGIADESWMEVFTTLTKFGADRSNIRQYTKAVENLAGMLGGDLATAAFLFGKAMQGSTEMLGRYGIQVDSAKSDTEKLDDVMRQLAARGAGQLEAQGNTLEGNTRKIALAWGDVKEGIGQAIVAMGDFIARTAYGAKSTQSWMSQFAKGLGVVAGWFGDKANTSGARNRSVLVGETPEAQAEADEIEEYRAELLASRNIAEQEIAKASRRHDEHANRIGPFDMRDKEDKAVQADMEKEIAKQVKWIDKIDAELERTALEIRKKKLRRVTPAEADKLRAAQVPAGPEFGPGGDAEAIAKAAAARARREELELEMQIAEARAAGNKDLEARLTGQREYNRLLKQAREAGMADPEDYARRGAAAANAKTAEKAKETPAPAAMALSSLAARGGSMGEGLVASRMDMQARALAAATKATEDLTKTIQKGLKVEARYG